METTEFTDAELLAYLDEGLATERMATVESELRRSAALRQRTAALRGRRDQHGHTVSDIWRRGRLSCPERNQLGSFLLGALPQDLADYIDFHLSTVGCRYCIANLEDLKHASQTPAETTRRRQKFFQSSAGYVQKREDGR